MPTTNLGHFLVVILAIGFVNYIATVIIVYNEIFKDARAAVRSYGTWLEAHPAWAQIHKLSSTPRRTAIGGHLARLFSEPSNKRKDRPSWIGPKLQYLAGCPMCVGVWIGFIQAIVFGGPFHITLPWHIFGLGVLSFLMTVVANGLLYKAIGHTVLQICAVFHNMGEWFKARARYYAILNGDEQLGEYLVSQGVPQPADNGELASDVFPEGDLFEALTRTGLAERR